jgi:hypothetical protein
MAARNPGLAALRLRRAAEQNERLRELMPDEIDVTKLRKFAEDSSKRLSSESKASRTRMSSAVRLPRSR